jgi:hypothetical protein
MVGLLGLTWKAWRSRFVELRAYPIIPIHTFYKNLNAYLISDNVVELGIFSILFYKYFLIFFFFCFDETL